MWCVAELNEEYVGKMEDVLELYEKEHNPAEPVVCLDEKSVTLHKHVRAPKPAVPGQPAKTDSEYERCGTANVFCAVEPKAGRHYTRPTVDRSAPEFAQILAELALHYPDVKTIHLVVDNWNIHHRQAAIDHYGEEAGGRLWSRFTVHYTPKHGSWLNQAEIEISLFSRQCLGKRRIPTLTCLRAETKQWNAQQNQAGTKINWRFTRKDARRSNFRLILMPSRLTQRYQARALRRRVFTRWNVFHPADVCIIEFGHTPHFSRHGSRS